MGSQAQDRQPELVLAVALQEELLHHALRPLDLEVLRLRRVRDVGGVESLAEEEEHVLPLDRDEGVGGDPRLQPPQVLEVHLE